MSPRGTPRQGGRRTGRQLVARLVVALGLCCPMSASAALVVDNVASGERDGDSLQVGDLVERWQVEVEGRVLWRGRLGSFVDWRYLIDEIVPRRRPIEVFGQRADGSPLVVELVPPQVGVTLRPDLDEASLASYLAGRRAVDTGRRTEGLDIWEGLFDRALDRDDRPVAVWIGLQIATHGDPRLDDARVRSVLSRLGDGSQGIRERTVVLEAELLWELRRADFAAAKPLLHEALTRHRAAADPIGQARCLYRLGLAHVRGGDPVGAEPFYDQALALYTTHAPDGLAEAATHIGLGHTKALLGALREAEEHWLRSLGLYQELAPTSDERVGVLYNLGSVAAMVGDLALSERYLHTALELETERGDGTHRAGTLNNLGELAMRRGDMERAVEHFTEALRLKREKVPDDVGLASTLANLGHVALQRGDVDEAEAWFAQAIAQVRRTQPDSLHEAMALENAARASLAAGDTERASARLARARSIAERTAPDGQHAVETDCSSAELAVATGELAVAAEFYERAIARLEATAPNSQRLAEVLAELAEVRVLQDDIPSAIDGFERAIDVLEAQVRRVGGPPGLRDRFRAGYHLVYRRQIELLVGEGRADEAFAVLERSRAQGLLELLSGRDLRLDAAPPDLDRRRRALAARYSRGIHRLATLTDAEDRQRALADLAELRRQRDEVIEALWREAPHVAGLQHPRPLAVDSARAALDPGTLLLSWSVGDDRTILFALGRDAPIRVAELPIGEAALARRVDRFVDLIRDPRSASAGDVAAVARRLGDELLGPMTDAILGAERLLLSPDGPLHRLPFAALRLPPGGGGGGDAWLVELRPMTRTPSMTVLAELHRRRSAGQPEGALRLAAFGAPRLPSPEAVLADRARRAVFGEVSNLAPLPASAHEVDTVVRLFPRGEAFLGDRATEGRVKSVASTVDVLHFATHALVDETSPLESALVLSLPEVVEPGGENGLLQVWEIFEDLRLDAELVVLSACGTALGTPVRGEGLLGLERAFHFAGARSVLASLWPVSDVATSRLMERFYRHLHAGSPRDEALRRAQLAALSGEITGADGVDPSAPVHWAAFRLSGDATPLSRQGGAVEAQ